MVPPFAITLSPPANASDNSSTELNSKNQSSGSENYNSSNTGYSTSTFSQATPSTEAAPGREEAAGEKESIAIRRKFKPQLIDTVLSHNSAISRRDSDPQIVFNTIDQIPSQPQPLRQFAQQLLDTSTSTQLSNLERAQYKPDRRRFSPQLVETTRRSRRPLEATSSVSFTNRKDIKSTSTPSLSDLVPRKFKVNADILTPPSTASIHSPAISLFDTRRRGINLTHRSLSQSSNHSHHILASGLDTIESSESDISAQASPITSHSPSPISFSYISQVNRARECIDNQPTGYLLARAARNAQKQLQEEGLAAFANNDRHEPISHFVDRIDATPAPSSRGSQYDLDFLRRSSSNWELREIQKHHEMLEGDRERERKRREARRKLHKHLGENPWSAPVHTASHCSGQAPESHRELQKMLEKARPPMLGQDLVFPRSQSPDSARFDVTQGPESLKKTMCYLSNLQDNQQSSSTSLNGLWCASPPPKPESVISSQWSRPTSRAPSTQGGGLWGGSCLDSGMSSSPGGPTGIMTPKFDEDDLTMASKSAINVPASASALLQNLPPSPPVSNSGIACSFTERFEVEVSIESEFDDSFITQVYNYLSLGYPAVARDYDEELAKISRSDISELRADDDLATGARGYIRLGEEELNEGVTEDMCARWKALKVYIHEWARQQPNMSSKPKNVEGLWGSARKGSWAF